MHLLDHFRPPLSTRRHWHAFHNAWATYIASALNTHLPAGYFAEPNVQFGIEIDVATFDENSRPTGISGDPSAAANAWKPPAPDMSIALAMATDVAEVLVYDSTAGPTLAGAIELVSPANKDRPANREAFVSKGETYLLQGVGLAIVDVVTERRANLHVELLARLSQTTAAPGIDHDLYVAAYRPIEREGQPKADVWHKPLSIGLDLPTMPLWLRGGICLPVELAESYERTCREQRIEPPMA
jgi:hypothetical protein